MALRGFWIGAAPGWNTSSMDIRISRSAHKCAASGRKFHHEEQIHSRVRIQDGALVREDYAGESWSDELARGAYSVWTAQYIDPEVENQEPEEAFSPLRRIFYDSVEAATRIEQAKAFLAAQLLRRQKVFRQMKESDESDGETRILLYADRVGDRLIEVRDPSFTYSEMEEARTLLLQQLQELEQEQEADEEEGAEDAETTDEQRQEASE